MLALWPSVWYMASTQQMLFPSPFSTILPPVENSAEWHNALFLNSITGLSKIPVILECLREGEWWKARPGRMLGIGHGVPLSIPQESSHEVTGAQKWGNTSNTHCPQNSAPFDILGICLTCSHKCPTRSLSFQSYFWLTSLKFFQHAVIFLYEPELGTYTIIQCWLLHLPFLPYLMTELTAAYESESGFMRSINISDRIFISFPPFK